MQQINTLALSDILIRVHSLIRSVFTRDKCAVTKSPALGLCKSSVFMLLHNPAKSRYPPNRQFLYIPKKTSCSKSHLRNSTCQG